MNDAIKVSKLDFLAIKPYITIKNILIYFLVMLSFFYTDFVNRTMLLAAMISITYSSYPFLVGEESGIEDLYKIFGISDKNIVKGRYIYVIALTSIMFLMATILSLAVEIFFEKTGDYEKIFVTAFVLMMTMIFISSVQLPFYFKLSFKSAKTIIFVPIFVFIFIGYFAVKFLKHTGKLEAIVKFLNVNKSLVIISIIVFLILMVFISFKISEKVYSGK